MKPPWRLWVVVFGCYFLASTLRDLLHGHWWGSLLVGAVLGAIVPFADDWVRRPLQGEGVMHSNDVGEKYGRG